MWLDLKTTRLEFYAKPWTSWWLDLWLWPPSLLVSSSVCVYVYPSLLLADLLLFIAKEGAGLQWLPKEVVVGWLYNRALYHGAKPTRLWALGSLGCLVFLEDGAGTMGPERHHSTWLVLLCLASGLHT